MANCWGVSASAGRISAVVVTFVVRAAPPITPGAAVHGGPGGHGELAVTLGVMLGVGDGLPHF